MTGERPWLIVRIELESPTGEAVKLGPVIVQGMERGKPLVLQVPVYGQSHLSDGWPADPIAFGEVVRRARTSRGWSMATLARRAKLTELTIRTVERGRSNPSPQTREALIAVLGHDVTSPQNDKEES